jgi:excisionase family DNA binding protein
VPDDPHPIGLLDVGTLADRLGVTPRFVRRLVHERRVPFLKIGKFVRFDPREIETWVDCCRTPLGAPPASGINPGAASR